ncbi:MAG: hypothetical protein HY897_03950 [Deltaproteobacteria bacterium]|nr:hypothetical protein [Deltaproteobacteria bacterium]
MKKVLFASAILALLAFGALSIACSSPCDDVAAKCEACTDATIKAACDAAAKIVVDAGDDDGCDAFIDLFETAYATCK